MIKVQNFSKSFGNTLVIKDLSFEVKKGEIFAFLGSNGSGKTTTIRTLLGIYSAHQGALTINDQPFSHKMAEFIGYLPEERGLYATSRVLETLVYFGTLKGLSEKEANVWSHEYLEKVNLAGKEKLEIKKLSSGQQQKIQLGITIINNPQLLILDEPTKGLDPLNRSLLMDMLLELNKKGSTIVFVTHQMEEVEKIADRLIMIKDGQRVLYGDVQKVKEEFGSNTITLRFHGEFPQNEHLYTHKVENRTATIIPREGIQTNQILEYLIQEGIGVEKYEVATPSLHDIFIQISKGEIS